MRVWDISRHPEILRWVGKTKALYTRHEMLVEEFARRGYNHHTLLDKKLAKRKKVQDFFIHTIPEQRKILKSKNCDCFLYSPSYHLPQRCTKNTH